MNSEIKINVNDIKVTGKEGKSLKVKLVGILEGYGEVEIDVPNMYSVMTLVTKEVYDESFEAGISTNPGRNLYLKSPYKTICELKSRIEPTRDDMIFFTMQDVRRSKLIDRLKELELTDLVSDSNIIDLLNTYKNDEEMEKAINLLSRILKTNE